MSNLPYEIAFHNHNRLITHLGEGNAYLIWAMGLILDKTDLIELASECLTDASDDKKIDFICLDLDERRVVFSQGYYSSKNPACAPANKASDLNTATAWLFSGDINTIPERLRSCIQECRSSIENGEIDNIQLYYVHNLPESINVARELHTIEQHHSKILKDKEILITAKEIGVTEVNRLYTNKETDIVIHDEIDLKVNSYFTENGEKWNSYVFSISGKELRYLYDKYSADLFSANYRSFLGASGKKKINNVIRSTAEKNKNDFWVYNNGITILTKKATYREGCLTLSGISIINGAQTTGSIGSAESKNSFDGLHILCRAVECLDNDTISKIVQYNNTQNVIKAWDRYSNNEVQNKLERSFKTLGHSYCVKRSASISDMEISIENVVQPLLAWLGDYKDASRGRNSIFERKELYDKAFNTSSQHILFVYSLSRCMDNIKINLKNKINRTEKETKALSLLTHFRFKYFFISIVANTISEFIGTTPSKQNISFTYEFSKRENNTIIELASMWDPFIQMCIKYIAGCVKKDFSLIWGDDTEFDNLSNSLQTFIATNDSENLIPLKDSIEPLGS